MAAAVVKVGVGVVASSIAQEDAEESETGRTDSSRFNPLIQAGFVRLSPEAAFSV